MGRGHHDVCVVNAGGRVVAKGRVPQRIAGVARLHELGDLGRDDPKAPVEVVVGIETDRGLLVRALLAAGYAVVAVNPMAVDRYRDRHRVSGAKSDPGDARVLADLVRLIATASSRAGDSDEVEALKLVARAHQNAIWSAAVATATSDDWGVLSAVMDLFDDVAPHDALAVLTEAHPDPGPVAVTVQIARRCASGRRTGSRPGRADTGGPAAPALESRRWSPMLRHGRGLAGAGCCRYMPSRSTGLEGLSRVSPAPGRELLRSLPGWASSPAPGAGWFGDDPDRF